MARSASQRGAEEQLELERDPATIPVQRNTKGQEVFVKGVGVHLWQSSGDKASNWTHLLKSWAPLNFLRFAMARLRGGPTVLEVCPNSWDRYDEDSALAQSLGCNGFRLSLEWSRIEPIQGHLDMEAVQRYRDIFDSLLSRGMTPNVTLHHFTAPQWFMELGGWTRPENIKLFVEYAVKGINKWRRAMCSFQNTLQRSEQQRRQEYPAAPFLDQCRLPDGLEAVRLFGDQVKLWATFNEPVSSSSMGWIFGAYPPGSLMQFGTSGEVLLNMLRAHTAAYDAIKALPGGEQHKIGLTHMMLPFSNWPDLGPFTLHSRLFARWMDFWWGYDVVHNYLLTGRFAWFVPSISNLAGAKCTLDVQDARPPLDWFGVNFYSRPIISPAMSPGRKPWQVLSDLGYPIDPDGLHEVIKRASTLRVPMYVTETGVSIPSSSERCYTVDSYMKEILRAMREGLDVRGMYYWTLLDNFEWNAGYSIKFGLYEWSPWPWGKDRAKRPAADTLAGYYRSLPDSLADTKTAVKTMDLHHKGNAPLPKSPIWWFFTLVLLSLGVWQGLIKSGLHASFRVLELLSPTAAGWVEVLQQKQQPPWKDIGGKLRDRRSFERSSAAQQRASSDVVGSMLQGLANGDRAVSSNGAATLDNLASVGLTDGAALGALVGAK